MRPRWLTEQRLTGSFTERPRRWAPDLVSLRGVAGVTMLAALILLAIAGVHVQHGVPIPSITRDMAAVGQLHPLTGVLSAIGVLLWMASAAIWFFAALVFRDRHGGAAARFALGTGALSLYLCLDDLFMIHEELAPRYLGVPERGVHAVVLCWTVIHFALFLRRLLRPDAAWLLLALAMLATSMALDTVLEPWLWRLGDWVFLLEDGFKWLGICFWLAFAVTRCRADLAQPR